MPMPGLRTWKGLGRRKSATPAQEEPSSPPTPTRTGFRVLERPPPVALDKRTWSEEDSNSSNRGSGSSATTANSRHFDRRPISSTSPPPVNDTSRRTNRLSHLPPQTHLPSNGQPRGPPSRPGSSHSQRLNNHSRSGSFLGLPQDLEQGNFSDMFSGFGEGNGRDMNGSVANPTPTIVRYDSEPILSRPDNSWPNQSTARTPPPMGFRRHPDLEPSPRSLGRKSSRDRLLASPSPSPSPYRDEPRAPPSKSDRPLSKIIKSEEDVTDYFASTAPNFLRKSESVESFARTGAGEDADARMVRNSVIAMRKANSSGPPSPQRKELSSSSEQPRNSNSSTLHPTIGSSSASNISTKSPSMTSSTSESVGDSTLSVEKRLSGDALKSDTSTSANTTPRQVFSKPAVVDDEDAPLAYLPAARANKRMSFGPAPPPKGQEFKNSTVFPVTPEPANLRTISPTAPAFQTRRTSPPSINLEPQRRTSPVKQSRKDAQEAAYRQKPTKEVGESSSRPIHKHASQSTPNLLLRDTGVLPTLSEDKKSDSDDDDDIPLAVLQAHNFPSKSKQPDLRFSQYSSYSGSNNRPASTLAPPSVMNNRTSLPPFARRLPQDPYGSNASLMQGNASRDSLLLGNNRIYPPPGHSPVPGIPPGGLVGVIAEEEKLKNYRRTNTNNDNRLSTALPSMGGLSAGMSMGMQGLSIPGLGPGLGPQPMQQMAAMQQDQGVINQQLLQVVQQQTFMLNAMYAQMQQMGGGSPVLDQNGFEQPAGRPMSIASQSRPPNYARTQSMVNLNRPQVVPRTMSMIHNSTPSFLPNWDNGPLMHAGGSVRGLALDNYAPSVAPSERSNIGQPSRYRPVYNGSEVQSTAGKNPPTPPLHADESTKKKKSGFFSAMMHPKGKETQPPPSQEEEDWGAFASRKRQSGMPAFR